MLTRKEPLDSLTDEEVLVLSIKTPSYFRVIMNRYEAAFFRKARAILGPREEVADAVVETFSKIYLKADRFRPQPGASFKSWAYKILVNTTFTYYRRLQSAALAVSLDDTFWMGIGYEPMEKESLRDLVLTTLARLPEALARILRMQFLEDRPQKEIARREGISLAAAKTRIHRAKKEFKKQLLNLNDGTTF
jgi:RNA polymerase sigma-70 factor, ECF subfamily